MRREMLPQVRLPPEQLPALVAREPPGVRRWGLPPLGRSWHPRFVPAPVRSQVRWTVEHLQNNFIGAANFFCLNYFSQPTW